MDWTMAVTIIVSILVPMIAGFGWLIHRMDGKFTNTESKFDKIEERLNRIEVNHGERLARIETMLYRVYNPLDKTGS